MFMSSSVEYDGLEIIGILFNVVLDGLAKLELLCPLLDGLVRLVLHLFLNIGLFRQPDGLEMNLFVEVGMQLKGLWLVLT